MASHRRLAAVVASGLIVLAACGGTRTPSATPPTPSQTPSVAPRPTPGPFTWSVGDPAEPAEALPPLGPRVVGHVGPLGDATWWRWRWQLGRGAHREGLMLGRLDGSLWLPIMNFDSMALDATASGDRVRLRAIGIVHWQ